MVLLEDSRQQPGKHKNIEQYCQNNGIIIRRSKLYVGDYQIANKGDIVVDSKASVAEIASIVFQEHVRFRDECVRAQEAGIKLFVLIEEVLPGGLLENWRSPTGRDGLPRYKFDPIKLKKTLLTMQDRYGCLFRFCDGRSTGRVLLEYLRGERE